MPCPFCGGEVSVVVVDEEGNIRDEEYERDPYSGLSYAVAHDDPNGACPIATYDGPLPWLYDSRDSVSHVWNRRAERTCRDTDYDTESITCSECGEITRETLFWVDVGGGKTVKGHRSRFCSNCGARLVDE